MSQSQDHLSSSALSLNTLFDLLRNPRRRTILTTLCTHGHTLTVNDLTKRIVVHEQETPITDAPSMAVTRRHLSLQHDHIPKLAETPLIEYDEDRQHVEPTDHLMQLKPLLSTVSEADSAQALCRNS